MGEIQQRLRTVQQCIQQLIPAGRKPPRLLAVSKYQSHEKIAEAAECDQLHFGENYVAELVTKAPLLPDSLKWHFIGHLQSNKCKQLANVPNLWCVESVDSARLADKLNSACAAARQVPLRVMVQIKLVEDSDAKTGCDPNDAQALALHIAEVCPSLRFTGYMTIGSSTSISDTLACFRRMNQLRTACFSAFQERWPESEKCRPLIPDSLEAFELSMGMSGDMQQAIENGSTELRVGSAIFGARPPSKPTSS